MVKILQKMAFDQGVERMRDHSLIILKIKPSPVKDGLLLSPGSDRDYRYPCRWQSLSIHCFLSFPPSSFLSVQTWRAFCVLPFLACFQDCQLLSGVRQISKAITALFPGIGWNDP